MAASTSGCPLSTSEADGCWLVRVREGLSGAGAGKKGSCTWPDRTPPSPSATASTTKAASRVAKPNDGPARHVTSHPYPVLREREINNKKGGRRRSSNFFLPKSLSKMLVCECICDLCVCVCGGVKGGETQDSKEWHSIFYHTPPFVHCFLFHTSILKYCSPASSPQHISSSAS